LLCVRRCFWCSQRSACAAARRGTAAIWCTAATAADQHARPGEACWLLGWGSLLPRYHSALLSHSTPGLLLFVCVCVCVGSYLPKGLGSLPQIKMLQHVDWAPS
jgi:hypothetical protein